MNEVRLKTESLIKEYVKDIIYQNHDTWANRLDLMKNGLEIITDINAKQNVSNEDKVLVRNIIEDLIKLDVNNLEVDITSNRRKKIHEASEQLKAELTKLSCVEIIESIETFDDWIKSLRIYKLDGVYLNLSYYESSYNLYADIRKIVLKRNSTQHQQIYALRVSEKLLEPTNQQTLPTGMTLEKGDYELFEIIRLINNNPQYYYRLKRSPLYTEINNNFSTKEQANKLYLLLKQPENH